MSIRKTIAILLGTILLASTSTVGFCQTSIVLDGAQLRLIYDVEVAAQADGIIQELLSDEGQIVNEDQILVRIDSRVADAEVAVAGKELLAAEKQAEQTADMEYAKLSHKVAEAEFQVIDELERKGAASLSERRRAELEKDKGFLAIGVAVIKHEQDQLASDVAREKLNAARVRLGLYSVKSPVDGMVVERLRDRGEWIRAGEPILRVVHLKEMKVECRVPVTKTSPSELLGAKMTVTIPVSPDFVDTIETNIEFVSPIVDLGEVLVWGKIPNKRRTPNGPWMFSSGMHVDVKIDLN
ncbi:MAG: HlyD family efflux transporter periplasmic adaptor subunit [Planctomycetales bacterium]|nr:HlyD family efflux transporter periplasmic adaptor subunit [Planctomycetales bacterium]